MSTDNPPRRVGELTSRYLSQVAAKLLSDPTARVTSFAVTPDPFEFPRFGDKEFYESAFEYSGRDGPGRSTVILRVLPPMDAGLMLPGDTEHRELKAFQTGLYKLVPDTFHVPYVHVELHPAHGQYWAFVEDVRPEMEALGMHAVLPERTIRVILSHLAAFHAAFWARDDILRQPWLMRLGGAVGVFSRRVRG